MQVTGLELTAVLELKQCSGGAEGLPPNSAAHPPTTALKGTLRPTREALGGRQVDVHVADHPQAHAGVLDDAVVQAAQAVGDEDLAGGPAQVYVCKFGLIGTIESSGGKQAVGDEDPAGRPAAERLRLGEVGFEWYQTQYSTAARDRFGSCWRGHVACCARWTCTVGHAHPARCQPSAQALTQPWCCKWVRRASAAARAALPLQECRGGQ